MEFLKLSAVILITVILVSGLPTFNKEISLLVTFSCCTVVLLYIINFMTPVVSYIGDMAEKISFEGIDIVLKVVGVGFITQFISDVANDCGNKSLANQMILTGKISVLMLAIPVFLQIFEIIEQLIN